MNRVREEAAGLGDERAVAHDQGCGDGKAQKERIQRDGFEWHMSHHKYHLEFAMDKMYDILGADELAQKGTAEERAKMIEKFERFRVQRHIAMFTTESWVASMTGDETIESLHAEYVDAVVRHAEL